MTTVFSDHPLKYSVHTRLREHYIRRMIGKRFAGRILDIGCGSGYFLELFGRSCDVFGVDRDVNSIARSRERGIPKVALGDAARLPFASGSFDVVICSELLEHLSEGVDHAALAEIERVLRPGGRAIITVPAKEGVRARSPLRNLGHDDPRGGEYHYRIGYSEQELFGLIGRSPRLAIERRRYSMVFFGELFMDILKWMYFRKYGMRDHSDIMQVKDTAPFMLYKAVFPAISALFIAEDYLLAPALKGHIHIVMVSKKG